MRLAVLNKSIREKNLWWHLYKGPYGSDIVGLSGYTISSFLLGNFIRTYPYDPLNSYTPVLYVELDSFEKYVRPATRGESDHNKTELTVTVKEPGSIFATFNEVRTFNLFIIKEYGVLF